MTATAAWLAGAAMTLSIPLPGVALTRLPQRGGPAVRSVHPGPVAASGAVVLCIAVGVLRGPVVAAALLIAAASVGFAVCDAGRSRRRQTEAAGLLAATRVIRAELSAGSLEAQAMDAAVHVAGPAAETLRSAARRAADGDLDAVVAQLAAHPPAVPLAAAWRVRARLGVPLGAALSQVERAEQDRLAQQRTVGELLAGPRASALVLAGLPVVGLLLGAQMGAHPIGYLTESPAGRLVLLAGASLTAAGLFWSVALGSRAEQIR